MKILLDENFPLPLYHRLRAAGYEADHIVILGQRGLPDTAIRQRLLDEDLVFLTQDTEFEDVPPNTRGVVIISRVPQSLPIRQRVEIWLAALSGFMVHRRLVAARRAGRPVGDVLAELGPSVLHLHVHTKGLDRLVDTLEQLGMNPSRYVEDLRRAGARHADEARCRIRAAVEEGTDQARRGELTDRDAFFDRSDSEWGGSGRDR